MFSGLLAAQRPVVNVGGPTPNYQDLPAAVAAAPTGAVIVVWPGSYTGFATNRALRIELLFGPGGGVILPAPGSNYTIQVGDLPPGEGFSLFGLGSVVASGALGAIRIHNNGAPVVMESITASAGLSAAVEVQNSAAVLLHHCVFAGTPALQAQNSSVVSTENVLLSTTGAGAIVNSSLFESIRTAYTSFGLPALRVFDSNVRLAGNSTVGFTVIGSGAVPVSAFEAINSFVQWDEDRFPMVSLGGAAGFSQYGSTVFDADVPMMITNDAATGALATANMSVGVPTIGFIALGNLRTPAIFGVGGIYFDTVQAPIIAAVGLVDAQGLGVQVAVPNTGVLRGELFCLQGVVWQANGIPLLSGPGIWSVR